MPVLTQMATSGQAVQQVVNPPDGVDPTVLGVSMAFIAQPNYGPPPDPQDGDWNDAGWVTEDGPVYWASCLVGPGGVVLAKGDYLIAVRITTGTAAPELWGWGITVT